MSSRGITIKVDNRETDLIPLIERRIEAHLSDAVVSSSHETSKKSKNGCLVPLHMFDNVEVSNDILPRRV